MGEPAKKISVEAASVEGLEDVFLDGSQDSHTESQVIIGEIQDIEGYDEFENSDSYKLLSIPEASKLLEIPQSTLYRHVKEGRYRKVRGRDSQIRIAVRRDSLTESQNSHKESSLENTDSQDKVIESQAISGFQSMSEKVFEMSEKLESANYRIGYLTSQLESSKDQIRLLEDKSISAVETKQNLQEVQEEYALLEEENNRLVAEIDSLRAAEKLAKRSSWQKFSDWFLGRKVDDKN
tara:strand:- start:3521 stop:4231 length:711 start_codon:yes stop_codon:yes gene_type:complete